MGGLLRYPVGAWMRSCKHTGRIGRAVLHLCPMVTIPGSESRAWERSQ